MGEREHTNSHAPCAACGGGPCAFYLNALRTAQADGASDYPELDPARPVVTAKAFQLRTRGKEVG